MPQHPIDVAQGSQTLRGMVYRPDAAGRVPCVLMLHGFTGQRMESGFLFVYLARRLVEHGIAAVCFDFRGSGESDGRFRDMLVSDELNDALRMTQWLPGQLWVDRSRLGLLGFSLGGLLAACTVARSDVYRSLMLLAPTTVENLARYAGGREASEPVVLGPHTLHPEFFTDLNRLDPLADASQHRGPALLVQGTGDEAVRPEVSQLFADRLRQAGIRLQHELIPEANHAFARPDWRDRLTRHVTEFAAASLRG